MDINALVFFPLGSVVCLMNRVNTHLPGKLPEGRMMDTLSSLDPFQTSDSDFALLPANRVSSNGVCRDLQPVCRMLKHLLSLVKNKFPCPSLWDEAASGMLFADSAPCVGL